jgi:Rhodopirellula transposase DDE domain
MERLRRAGAGRTRRGARAPTRLRDRAALVDSTPRGEPQSPWRWTGTRVRRLATALQAQGHRVSPQLVSARRRGAEDRVQGTRQTRAGGRHPDRDAPCEHIATRVRDFHTRGQPVSAVAPKQKARGGDDKHAGRAWPPQGPPPEVRVHDCIDPKPGKVTPDGVDDVGAHVGWVRVGIDHDPPALAVATIRAWWLQRGSAMSPKAQELLLTADRGGSPRARARLWQRALQRFSADPGRRVCVSHVPPGTSPWHTIEPRRVCHSTATWRGQPLESREVVVSLMGGTSPVTGLPIRAALERGQ